MKTLAFLGFSLFAASAGIEQEREVYVIWGPGYFPAGNPIGGQQFEEFCRAGTKLDSLTIITTREDSVSLQTACQFSKEHAALWEKLRVFLIEDWIAALKGETVTLDGSFSKQRAKAVADTVKSPEYLEVSRRFHSNNSRNLQELAKYLVGNKLLLPLDDTRNASYYFPNYETCIPDNILSHQIAFFISQLLLGQGNPAAGSDWVRFLYPLFCRREARCVYFDIDAMVHLDAILTPFQPLTHLVRDMLSDLVTADEKVFLNKTAGTGIDVIAKRRQLTLSEATGIISDLLFIDKPDCIMQSLITFYFSTTSQFLGGTIAVEGSYFQSRVLPYITFIERSTRIKKGKLEGKENLFALLLDKSETTVLVVSPHLYKPWYLHIYIN